MRLIAPLLFCMIGAIAGATVALLFRGRGTGVRGGALAGLAGGFVGLLLLDLLDLDRFEVFAGALTAALAGAVVASLALNLAFLVRGRR